MFSSSHTDHSTVTPPPALLIVDDEKHICSALKRLFHQDGYVIHTATSSDEADYILDDHSINVVISDQRMPKELGTDFLNRVQGKHPETIRMILSGYSDINDITRAMDTGAIYKFLTKPWDDSLLRANVREAFHRANELAKLKNIHSDLNVTDSVTGLGNRQHLAKMYTPMLKTASSQKNNLFVLLLHLDQYEPILLHLGEASINMLLEQIANALSNSFGQEVELGYTGEGTFCALVIDIDIDTCLERITQIIKHTFATVVEHDNHEMLITFSIGAEDSTSIEHTFKTRFENARIALHDSMTFGHSGIRVYDRQISTSGKRRLTIENDLKRAIECDQLQLVYQPQISVADGGISGFESLLRWKHPELGSISPVEFIPISEENRLIIDIGLWVLDHSIQQFKEWETEGLSPKALSVNVSPVQMQQPGLADQIARIMEKHQWPKDKLVIEITESTDLSNTQISQTLIELHTLGVALAIDDFGTGYANFTNLTQLPISKVKIDRSLILAATSGEKHRRLFDKVVSMSHDLGFETVVEGVETPEELAIATENGCHIIQGYFYSPPLVAEQCYKLIKDYQQTQ